MKYLLAILCIFYTLPAFAQQPQVFLGVEAQSLTNRMSLDFQNPGLNLEEVSSGSSLKLKPYLEMRIPRGAILRYSYTPTLENRFTLSSEDKLLLWGTEFKEDTKLDIISSTSIHSWQISWQMPASPLVTMDLWKTSITAKSGEDTASEGMSRFVLGLGCEISQPVSSYALFQARGAYTFLGHSRGYFLDGSIMTGDPLAMFPTTTKIGFSYRESTFLDEIQEKFRLWGPYLQMSVVF